MSVPPEIFDQLVEEKLKTTEGLSKLVHYSNQWLKDNAAKAVEGADKVELDLVLLKRVTRILEEADARIGALVVPGGSPERNPIKDEKTEYGLDEFVTLVKAEFERYADTFRGQNQGKHRWEEWMRSFHEYMSW